MQIPPRTQYLGRDGVSLAFQVLKGMPGEWELFALADSDNSPIQVAPEAPPTQVADRMVLATARRAPGLLRLIDRFPTRG